jgi:hypothetical protein
MVLGSQMGLIVSVSDDRSVWNSGGMINDRVKPKSSEMNLP